MIDLRLNFFGVVASENALQVKSYAMMAKFSEVRLKLAGRAAKLGGHPP